MYLTAPSEAIYALGEMQSYSGPYLDSIAGQYSNAFMIDNVEMVRGEESDMLARGSNYVLGRLGAEIAYVIGADKLGLKDIILQEPAVGGRDLYTLDNTVAIQARLINQPSDPSLQTTIKAQLADLVAKLGQDYENQPAMTKGYAILSFVDTDGSLKSIIVEVPRQ